MPSGEANARFVLTQEEVANFVQEELARLGRAYDYSHKGFLWRAAEPHLDRWGKLPR